MSGDRPDPLELELDQLVARGEREYMYQVARTVLTGLTDEQIASLADQSSYSESEVREIVRRVVENS